MELTPAQQKYITEHRPIADLLKNLIVILVEQKVEDVNEVYKCMESLRRRNSANQHQLLIESKKAAENQDGDLMDTNEEEEDDAPGPEPDMNRYHSKNRVPQRRGAISSEPVGSDDLEEKLSSMAHAGTPKSMEVQKQLEESVKNNLLFVHLEPEDRTEVFTAMTKIEFRAGDIIIRQGDEGDYFYIVDTGNCEVWKQENPSEPAKCVMKLRQLDSFGELALIYHTPRAATVKAVSDCTLWRIDRITYRRIIMGAQMRKRKLYDSFLEKVPILHTLQKYERLTVADALEPAIFNEGEVIIREGEPGDTFFIIVEGQVIVYKSGDDGVETEVARLYSSSYFGEIALLTDRPRAATVRSVGLCKCVKLDRDRFVRVMGPCEDILRRNMSIYNQYLSVNI